ncbi:MAG: sulfotransferase family 2 domain-containing protein [Phototrophicaceae bacterium]|jgi:hypothetical protein
MSFNALAIPHRLQPDDTLIFIHIPKTAGISFSYRLYQYFEWERIHPVPNPFVTRLRPSEGEHPAQYHPNLKAALHAATPNNPHGQPYQLVSGHYHFGVIARFARPVAITFLREPNSRLISNYHQAKKADDWNPFSELAQRLSLHDWLHHPQIQPHIKNLQTRQLAGTLWGDDPEPDDATLLAQAKANLARCAFVGLQERFEDGLLVFAYRMGWPLVTDLPKRNVGDFAPTVPSTLPQATQAALQALNALDFELYSYATLLWNQQVTDLLEHALTGGVSPQAAQGSTGYAKRIFEPRLRQHVIRFIQSYHP